MSIFFPAGTQYVVDANGVPQPVSPTDPMPVSAMVTGAVSILLAAATVVGAGAWVALSKIPVACQATVSGTGTVTGTVDIEVSNDGVTPIATAPLTINLNGTTTASDGGVVNAPWKYIRANLTAISGTSAAVIVLMGV